MLKAPFEIAGHDAARGRRRRCRTSYLMHTREDVYPDPFAFRPERFLEKPAGTYTWIPFGGGVRRCLGASFALFEMKAVLRAIADAVETLEPGSAATRSAPQRRAVTLVPGKRRPRHRGATSSACAPRATGPDRSLSTDARQPRAALGDLRRARPAAPTRPPARAGSAR